MGAAGPVAAVLSTAGLRRWVEAAVADLARHRGALDRLNVFPVRDADTGSNLHLTLRDAAAALGEGGTGGTGEGGAGGTGGDGADVDRLLRGALLGARGSSGVIVGQWLAGVVPVLIGESLPGTPGCPASGEDRSPTAGRTPAARTARALRDGALAARAAVGSPMDGTVLTVADALADAADEALVTGEAHGLTPSGTELWTSILQAGARSLEQTQQVHPVLRAAGVPDAGAWGLILVVAALARVMVPTARLEVPLPGDHVVAPAGAAQDADGPHGTGGEFEVMFVEEPAPGGRQPAGGVVEVGEGDGGPAGPTDALSMLRDRLSALGDSVAVVTAADAWQAHVHTDLPVEVLHLPVAAGRARHQVAVRHLLRQSGVHGDAEPDLGVVAVTRAPGLVPDLARAGAVVLLELPGRPVEPEEVARAVADTGGREALVLAAGRVASSGDADVRVHLRAGLGEAGVVAAVAALLEADSGASVTGTGTGTAGGALLRAVDDALDRLVRVPTEGAVADAARIAAAVLAAGGDRGAGLVRVLRGTRRAAHEPQDAGTLADAIAGAVRDVGGTVCDVVVLDLAHDLPDEISIEVEHLSAPVPGPDGTGPVGGGRS